MISDNLTFDEKIFNPYRKGGAVKKYLYSKTIWFNVTLIGSSVLAYLAEAISRNDALSAIGIGIIGVILRSITSQPLTMKK